MGFDISKSVNIENTIQEIYETSIAYLKLNKKKGIYKNSKFRLCNITKNNYYNIELEWKKKFNIWKFKLV